MTIENVRRKIRALLATAAEGSGATDPERETAKRLAEKLSAEYGIDQVKPRPAPAFELPAGPRPDAGPDQVVVFVNGQWYAVDRRATGFQFQDRNYTTTTNGGGFPW